MVIPFDQIFYEPPDEPPTMDTGAESDIEDFNWCGCGWPEYMLIPRGYTLPGGYPAQLFVMITDADYDVVDEPVIFRSESWIRIVNLPRLIVICVFLHDRMVNHHHRRTSNYRNSARTVKTQ